jgi:hypothetical protein
MSCSSPTVDERKKWHPLDCEDGRILAEISIARKKIKTPREGDFVILPDGNIERLLSYGAIASLWENGRRVERRNPVSTISEDNHGDFCLSHRAHTDPKYRNWRKVSVGYAGRHAFYESKLIDTGEEKLGEYWFAHHGESMSAGCAVHVEIPCRVYRLERTE